MPPDGRRFRFVHVVLELVPAHRQGDLLRHALEDLVAPGGRLLMSQYSASRESPPLTEAIRALGFAVAGEAHARTAAPAAHTTTWIER